MEMARSCVPTNLFPQSIFICSSLEPRLSRQIMEGRCQCGAVRFTTPSATPYKMYVCHCLECRRQSSSAFGISAIFPAFDLPASVASFTTTSGSGSGGSQGGSEEGGDGGGPLGVYTHSNTGSGRTKQCYFCKQCGTRIMHGGGNYVAVKGGCLEGLDGDLVQSATHIWTKRALVPIPEGVESFPEEPPA